MAASITTVNTTKTTAKSMWPDFMRPILVPWTQTLQQHGVYQD
jgi:hypothetical protein